MDPKKIARINELAKNTPIGMLETRCTKLNTAAEIAALRKARAKTKQRLCGTQQDREHKSAGSVWRERM